MLRFMVRKREEKHQKHVQNKNKNHGNELKKELGLMIRTFLDVIL